jgi:hypothetical protein
MSLFTPRTGMLGGSLIGEYLLRIVRRISTFDRYLTWMALT